MAAGAAHAAENQVVSARLFLVPCEPATLLEVKVPCPSARLLPRRCVTTAAAWVADQSDGTASGACRATARGAGSQPADQAQRPAHRRARAAPDPGTRQGRYASRSGKAHTLLGRCASARRETVGARPGPGGRLQLAPSPGGARASIGSTASPPSMSIYQMQPRRPELRFAHRCCVREDDLSRSTSSRIIRPRPRTPATCPSSATRCAGPRPPRGRTPRDGAPRSRPR
jgi:hypothetical protein